MLFYKYIMELLSLHINYILRRGCIKVKKIISEESLSSLFLVHCYIFINEWLILLPETRWRGFLNCMWDFQSVWIITSYININNIRKLRRWWVLQSSLVLKYEVNVITVRWYQDGHLWSPWKLDHIVSAFPVLPFF